MSFDVAEVTERLETEQSSLKLKIPMSSLV